MSKQEIPAIKIRGTKRFEGKLPPNIEEAAMDPKNPANQKAPKGASGRWAKRHEKKLKRSPQMDASGRYKVNGSLVTRPGKTVCDRFGGGE